MAQTEGCLCGSARQSTRIINIQLVCYDTDGCMNTNACANTVAELAEGRKVEDAWEITAEDVISF